MLTAALLSSFEVSSSFHWTYRSLGQLASFDRRVKSEKLAPYNSTYALKKKWVFCLQVCMSLYHSGAWCPQRSEKDLRSLELELQMVGSHIVGAGNQIWDLWNSSQCY